MYARANTKRGRSRSGVHASVQCVSPIIRAPGGLLLNLNDDAEL